jgi:hypothetical protein
MFYVLWRAWSHYKAYKGASYLERLLKLGMINEQPSKDLDAIYKSQSQSQSQGIEGGSTTANVDHAPDETSSEGVKLGEDGESIKDLAKSGVDVGKLDKAEGIDKGTGPAPDGTSTPKSLVYDPSASPPTSTPAQTSSSSNSSKPDGTHPSLLIRPTQVPSLAQAFNLRPNEVIDVTRAIEQAEMRARKIEQDNAGEDQVGKDVVKASKEVLATSEQKV